MYYPELESAVVEWKREVPKYDQIIKTVIGFCNHLGGKIVIGISDTGKIVGLKQEKIQEVLESIEKAIFEASYPTIIPRVSLQLIGNKNIIIIEVASGMHKPYYRKSEGLERGTYIRIGRSTMRATFEFIEELRWQSNGLTFETLPCDRSSKEDLDLKEIQNFLDHRKNHGEGKLSDTVMQSYHLMVAKYSELYPTNAGLLLFGKEPQHFLSEAMIICSHFQGIAGRDAIASVDCVGTLMHQFQQAYAFVISRLYTAFKIRGVKREETLELPEEAIREAILNAIIHRNYHIKAPTKIAIYDDRIEIHSPGLFPGPLDANNLKHGITYLRNPAICKVFREAGFVEKLGSGFITIFNSYEKRELSTPKVIEGANFIKVVLPRTEVGKKEKLDELSKIFESSSEVTLKDIQQILQISRSTASRKTKKWLEEKSIEKLGKTRATRYRRLMSS